MNMHFYRKLPVPKEIKEQFPITPEIEKAKTETVNALCDAISGKSDKFILIIGHPSLTRSFSH